MSPTLIPFERSLAITANGQAQFRFPFDEELTGLLKASLEAHWNGTLRAWCVRARASNIRAIGAFARAHGFCGVEEADAAQSRLFAAAKGNMVASRAADADFVAPPTLRGTLRPFQRGGVAYGIRNARGCLLADEMGLGKTVEAIAILESLDAFPAVIVCPASLKWNWRKEVSAWIPNRSTVIFTPSNEKEKSKQAKGSKRKKSDATRNPVSADITIINYDILAKNVEALRALKPKAVVFDEGHLLKTASTQRSEAACKLRRGVPVRLLLTGTPVLNTPSELLNPLKVLGRLDDMGGFWHFVKQYCGGKEVERTTRGGAKVQGWDLSGASNLSELAGRLRATCMVRRRKADVLKELPPKQLAMLPVEIDTRAEYDLARADVLEWVAKRAGQDKEFKELIAGLDEEEQIAAILWRSQRAVDRAAQAEELVKIGALKQIAARGKLAAAREWIENFLATGEKLVVFAWHQETLDSLKEAFKGVTGLGVISGETPVAKRQGIVDNFQARGRNSSSLILMNLQAGGVGLTLTAASNVLVLELPWTPALLDQAIDRCHRIGQQNAVTAWMMMGRRTIDYAIWKMLAAKRAKADGATR